MRSFGDVLLKSSCSSSQNLSSFGLDLIVQSLSFSKFAGWKNPILLGQDFSLSPVEPTLTFFCVGSTGEWSFHVLGFLGFSVVAPVHQNLHASDQPVLPLYLLFRSFNWRIDFPRRRLNRCSGCLDLLFLWTTTPVLWFCKRRSNRCSLSMF